MVSKQTKAQDRLVRAAERTFEEKQAARLVATSVILVNRKVDTVQSLLEIFYDKESIKITNCSVYYLKR